MPGDRLRAGLAVLEARYRVRVPDGVLSHTGYLAGSDERRAAEVDGLLRDPDVRAIFAVRGGYGVMRILPMLDASHLARDPKLLVGFSDVTALLAWGLRAGVRGIHGPVVAQLGELAAEQATWLFELCEGATPRIAGLGPIGALGAGRVEGPMLGGNLCLLAHLVGTPWQIDLGGALAFVEEVGERPYAIDRYLTRLQLAGALAPAAALVGDLVRCTEPTMGPEPDALAVVGERLARFGIHGLAGLPIGHGSRNLALPFGGRAAVDFAAGTLELLEPAVR